MTLEPGRPTRDERNELFAVAFAAVGCQMQGEQTNKTYALKGAHSLRSPISFHSHALHPSGSSTHSLHSGDFILPGCLPQALGAVMSTDMEKRIEKLGRVCAMLTARTRGAGERGVSGKPHSEFVRSDLREFVAGQFRHKRKRHGRRKKPETTYALCRAFGVARPHQLGARVSGKPL